MKNILTVAITCVCLIGFNACSDFLDENPKSSLTAGAFYKTEAQAQSNVNYLYRTGAPNKFTGAGSAYIGPFSSVTGMLTGYFTNSYEGQELVCKYSRELTRQENTMTVSSTMDGIWDDCYKAINVANGAIMHIPEISMSESVANQLIAEAKFFRAFNYFSLVKIFGSVPMPTEPYESMENLYLERTAADQVYSLIESDLKEAVEVLPAATFYNNGNRITKYAAAMLLTTVYMQEGKYSDAVSIVKTVIDSSHALATNGDLGLNSAYNKIRSTDGLDESIYSYEFDDAISNGGWWPTYAFSSSATAIFGTYSIFERVYGPTNQFLNVYEANDLRIQPNQFFHWNYTNPNTGKTWSSEVAGCWFWYDEEALLSSGRSTKDRDLFRYAEALLDAAESIAQSQGVTAEAAGYLAQIKARANMEGKTAAEISSDLQSLSKQAFIEECWTERLREFPLEFKIWDDCLRTKKFPVISTTEKGKVTYVDLVGAKNASNATFKESDLLWPISLNEMQRNPSLVQNEGYSE
ncbi:MAG: RagB/SusD family nutrient uptake outer membrane protein [Massilibacteroides sp.]|nr:RagB/SusD family nutrient uptake outer membrane protein [Massilibacteroides sp.]MDD3061366.1 RagB/SusD family nutrient uptake outer membrane protein [Massilibacteroides sp.]MDD4114883.1 RagB/SusD family nutrient uptake outer membrane protein [Massilibacteroides sp.]MDD4659457.1 RagB/SusD family nutrient uptake outer membrane protein [Massilibacteroides sp.]